MLTDEWLIVMQEASICDPRGNRCLDQDLQASKPFYLVTLRIGSAGLFKKTRSPSKPADLEQHEWVWYIKWPPSHKDDEGGIHICAS